MSPFLEYSLYFSEQSIRGDLLKVKCSKIQLLYAYGCRYSLPRHLQQQTGIYLSLSLKVCLATAAGASGGALSGRWLPCEQVRAVIFSWFTYVLHRILGLADKGKTPFCSVNLRLHFGQAAAFTCASVSEYFSEKRRAPLGAVSVAGGCLSISPSLSSYESCTSTAGSGRALADTCDSKHNHVYVSCSSVVKLVSDYFLEERQVPLGALNWPVAASQSDRHCPQRYNAHPLPALAAHWLTPVTSNRLSKLCT